MENEIPTLSLSEQQCSNLWRVLESFYCKWWHLPDLEAFRLLLACCSAHFNLSADPIWMFLSGPPGSGKTTAIEALLEIPNTHAVSDPSPNSFLSGFGKNAARRKESSLLLRMGDHGIILIKDFTTILSKRDDTKKEVAAILRELFDGSYSRPVGTGQLSWKGKATTIAAVTPVIERQWGLFRELGERFITVRWSGGDPIRTAHAAMAQEGSEREIRLTLRSLTSKFFSALRTVEVPKLSTTQIDAICHQADMVAKLRSHVYRDTHGPRQITESAEAEYPTRLAKAMQALARHHARLFGRSKIQLEDIKAARRICWDSVPHMRKRLLTNMPEGAPISHAELCKLTGLPSSTVEWHMEELEYLGIVTHSGSEIQIEYRISEMFTELRSRARLEEEM